MKNKILFVLFILITLSLGFYRDSLFVNINYQLSHLYYKSDMSHVSEKFEFIKQFSYDQLITGKWILTIGFTIAYYLLTIIVILLSSHNNKIIKWATISYITIFIVSGLFYVSGQLFGYPQTGYKLSRIFMGLLQSPIILMILFPLFHLSQKKV